MNQTYTVKQGDTLWGISNQFGVSVTELASLNDVDANSLQIGQTLKIPSKTGINPDNMFLYTVKKGDTLYSIAKVYGTSVSEIKKLNYLTGDSLVVGQVIRIPEVYTPFDEISIPNYINYTVKRGDNLYSIAREYGVDVNTLMQDNALSSTVLRVGQNLKIRVSKELEVEECFGEDYIPSESNTLYTVKKGDSLYSIARKYQTSVGEIVSLNNLKNNNLSIGQVLKIPSSSGGVTYQVIRGDNLYSIARKFGTTVDLIKKKNNLTNNNLSIGQILKI